MASIATITFNSVPSVDDYIELINPVAYGINGRITFKTQRLQPFQSTITTNGSPPSTLNSAFQYATSWSTDYNQSGLFTVNNNGNEVVISTDENNLFDGFTKSATGIDVVITNTPQTQRFRFTDVSYLEADNNKCSTVKVRLESNVDMVSINQPVAISNINATFVEFELPRAFFFGVSGTDGVTVDTISPQLNSTPNFLSESQITETITTIPSGNVLEVNYVGNINKLELEYSLDGTTYQTNNVFNGLIADTYTIHVRDQFGCVKTKSVVIGNQPLGQSTLDDFFFYSEANPILLSKQTDSDVLSIENKLSFTPEKHHKTTATHYFKPSDTVAIQFKTNLELSGEIRRCNAVEDVLAFAKITDNINKYDKRDAVKLSREIDGVKRLCVAFNGGDVYDINDTVIDGYVNTGFIPSMYNSKDSYVTFEGNAYLISNVLYNNDLNRFELVTSQTTTVDILETPIQIATYYNVQDYDVYESTFEFFDYAQDEPLQLKISYVNSQNETVTYYSEPIIVSEDIPDHHLIEYSHTQNGDLFFGAGYRALLRIPYDISSTYINDIEDETYQADDRLIGIDSFVREQQQFNFEALTVRQCKQLDLIFSHDVLFVDGDNYKRKEGSNVTRIGTSNLYKYQQTLQRLDVFNVRSDSYNSFDVIDSNGTVSFGFAYVVSGGAFVNSNGLVDNSGSA